MHTHIDRKEEYMKRKYIYTNRQKDRIYIHVNFTYGCMQICQKNIYTHTFHLQMHVAKFIWKVSNKH